MNLEQQIRNLELELAKLKQENQSLKNKIDQVKVKGDTVAVPDAFRPIFDKAQDTVRQYFGSIDLSPQTGTITINNERYVLIKASSLSYGFFQQIKKLYRDQGDAEAFNIGQNFLFDIGHVLGKEDARNFHQKMELKDPLEKLAAGPVHFAHSGWAFVEILAESRPVANEDFYLKYHHPYSFEANSWIRKGKMSDKPVCILNAAYSSGWCEQSFGVPLTAVEVACKAKGDDNCTFIMAPPNRIQQYLEEYKTAKVGDEKVPVFFERKQIENELKQSLTEKETLLREIHHRVKNNLQVITSLLNLQFNEIEENQEVKEAIIRSRNRINSMALIHTKLYQSNNLSSIDFGGYIEELLSSLAKTYALEKEIQHKVKHSNAFFHIDLSINLGLIINELVTNAYKHAFQGRQKGLIVVELSDLEEQNYCLQISDNGIGIDDRIKLNKVESLGLEIVEALAGQIEADIAVDSKKGLSYKISFSSKA